MADRIDNFVIFSTELYGFNKVEVGEYIAALHSENVRLYEKIRRLKRQLNNQRPR